MDAGIPNCLAGSAIAKKARAVVKRGPFRKQPCWQPRIRLYTQPKLDVTRAGSSPFAHCSLDTHTSGEHTQAQARAQT